MQLDWTTTHAAGVTLVTALLSNETGLDREVRLRNHLDGPVLPPRREGVFEAGWDRNGVTLVVAAGGRGAVGYACPVGEGDAAEPPVRIESARDPGAGTEPGGTIATSTTRALRSLGDPRPPRAVVASDDAGRGRAPPGFGDRSNDPHEGLQTASLPAHQSEADDEDYQGTADDEEFVGDEDGVEDEGSPTSDLPPPVDCWLAAVRGRVETLESLNDASVDEAATILDAQGGLAGVDALDADLDQDEAALRAMAARAERLADRAAETEAPTETLRRLT